MPQARRAFLASGANPVYRFHQDRAALEILQAVDMTLKQRSLFCFGLGYSATWTARALLAQGWRVAGTCRSEEKRQALSALGVEAHLFDRAMPLEGAARLLNGATHLLSSVPPDDKGDPVLELHEGDISRYFEGVWIGYLSTTGVYGDAKGGWVDEDSPLAPTGERGRRRVLAEAGWRALPNPAHVFRLAGIYGPGSSAIDSVRAGRARRIVKPGQVFSRIHVHDIAQILIASMNRPNPGRVYNLCDDDPAPPSGVIDLACDLLCRPRLPDTPHDAADLSPMARSFYEDNKRVRNDRIKRELEITLKYPSFRQGLPAILAGEQ